MLAILHPNTALDSEAYRQTMEYLENLPGVSIRVHEIQGASQRLTEIYLLGDTKSLEKAEIYDLTKYEKIIIGASIRYGMHNKKVSNFVKKNIKLLNQKKTAFFSVNVVARKAEKSTPETNPYILKFLKKTNWKPNKLSVFAGKVDYPNYNFFNKNVIRLIMFITKGPTDINNSYEFTNWEKVKKFAKELENL